MILFPIWYWYLVLYRVPLPGILPRIWEQGVKTEDLWNFGGQKSATQFTRIITQTLYIDIARRRLFLYIIKCTFCLVWMKLLKYFLWQKILQHSTCCHFAKNLVFVSQDDSLAPGWVRPCLYLSLTILHLECETEWGTLYYRVSVSCHPWMRSRCYWMTTSSRRRPWWDHRSSSPSNRPWGNGQRNSSQCRTSLTSGSR